ERPVLELDKIFSTLDLGSLLWRERETEFAQGYRQRPAIFGGTFDVKIGILGRIREAEENRTGFSKEEITNAAGGKLLSNFLRLAIFKRCHTRASREDSPRPSGGNPPGNS